MPLKDIFDDQHRLRPRATPPNRPPLSMDMRRAARPAFPTLGASLPPQRTLPTTPPPPTRPALSSRTSAPLREAPARSKAPGAAPVIKKRRRVITTKRIVLFIALLILVGGGWMATKIIINTSKIFHGNVFSILTTTKLKGEDTGRINILLAGNSADDPGHDGANLTDSIMVASIDTKNNTAFLLSVPRDLWVNIPGYGHAKINEAYVDGQAGNFSAPGYPNGGMGLLEEVVHQNFGISLNYYALIDYNALRDSVNAVGGIDVTIQSSDPRGLYDPSIDYATHGALVKLTNGLQHLSGEQALDLARARGDSYGSYGFPSSDFDRTQHQRQMILALKSKILTAGVLANPVALSNLFDSVGKNVHTDFSLSEARRLYDLSKNISNSSVQSVSLNQANGKNLLANYASPNGESALIPAAGIDSFGQIDAFVTRLTTSNQVVKEDASVVVLNGTDTVGLAAKGQATLVGKGVNVVAVGDAQANVPATTIIDASGGKMPATLQFLKQLYGAHVIVTTTNPYGNTYTANFIVELGPDQASVTPTQ